MKAESEKRMVKLIQLLTGDEAQKHVVQELQAILACEANEVKFGRLDLYKFTAKDDLRPSICGVYHDNGWQVATNGHMVIAVKQSYAEEREGKIIAKDGSVIEDRYPNWRAVIPAYTNEYKTFRMDMAELSEALRKAKAHTKVYGKDACQISLSGEIWFRPDLLHLFATAMKEDGADEIQYLSSDRGAVVKTDTIQLLLMPMIPPTEDELADDTNLFLTLNGK